MQLVRQNGVLLLKFPPDIFISFKESWIRELQKLPIDKYAEYIKTEIYPFFSSQERSSWMKSTINNNELETAIVEYLRDNKKASE